MNSLGFVTAILADEPLETVFKTASQLGYDCVEVMCWPPGKAERRYAGVTHVNVTAGATEFEHVHALTLEYGIAISSLGYYPNPLSPHDDEAELAVTHLRKVIGAAAEMNIGLVTTFIGRDWTRSVEDNWSRFLDTWGPLIEFAEQQQVRVAIENCPMLFTVDEWPGGKNLAISPAVWRRMFADLPSASFGLNYDPSHLIWQQMDAVAPLREFADRIFHVHAKDVRIDRQRLDAVGILAHPLEYHTPKLPGMGDVDWGHFFSILTDIGYTGPVCVEVEDRAYEGSLTARIASLRQSHDYLRQFVPSTT